MARENLRLKLLRMVSGQVRSYIADHPQAIHPHFVGTIHNSLSKRIAHELLAKGLVFDQRAIRALRASELAEPPVAQTASPSSPPHHSRPHPRPFKVEHRKRRKFH